MIKREYKLLKKMIIALIIFIGCTISFNVLENSVVKADTNSTNAELQKEIQQINQLSKLIDEQGSNKANINAIRLTFKKIPTLRVTKQNLIYPIQLVKKLGKIKVNHGKIQRFDFLMTNYYRRNKKGKLRSVKVANLHKSNKGILVMVVQISGLKPGEKYTFLNSNWPNYDLNWKTSKANKKGKLPLSSYSVVKVPFVIKK